MFDPMRFKTKEGSGRIVVRLEEVFGGLKTVTSKRTKYYGPKGYRQIRLVCESKHTGGLKNATSDFKSAHSGMKLGLYP